MLDWHKIIICLTFVFVIFNLSSLAQTKDSSFVPKRAFKSSFYLTLCLLKKTTKTENINTSTQVVESLKQEFEKIIEGVADASNVNAELEAIKISIDAISSKASKIDSLGGVIDGLKQQFETVSSTVNSSDAISLESIKELGGKIDTIETEISSLAKRADSTAFVGENLKAVQEDFSNFKSNVSS